MIAGDVKKRPVARGVIRALGEIPQSLALVESIALGTPHRLRHAASRDVERLPDRLDSLSMKPTPARRRRGRRPASQFMPMMHVHGSLRESDLDLDPNFLAVMRVATLHVEHDPAACDVRLKRFQPGDARLDLLVER
jgi:hypothetical protein